MNLNQLKQTVNKQKEQMVKSEALAQKAKNGGFTDKVKHFANKVVEAMPATRGQLASVTTELDRKIHVVDEVSKLQVEELQQHVGGEFMEREFIINAVEQEVEELFTAEVVAMIELIDSKKAMTMKERYSNILSKKKQVEDDMAVAKEKRDVKHFVKLATEKETYVAQIKSIKEFVGNVKVKFSKKQEEIISQDSSSEEVMSEEEFLALAEQEMLKAKQQQQQTVQEQEQQPVQEQEAVEEVSEEEVEQVETTTPKKPTRRAFRGPVVESEQEDEGVVYIDDNGVVLDSNGAPIESNNDEVADNSLFSNEELKTYSEQEENKVFGAGVVKKKTVVSEEAKDFKVSF